MSTAPNESGLIIHESELVAMCLHESYDPMTSAYPILARFYERVREHAREKAELYTAVNVHFVMDEESTYGIARAWRNTDQLFLGYHMKANGDVQMVFCVVVKKIHCILAYSIWYQCAVRGDALRASVCSAGARSIASECRALATTVTRL
jgi:hypothetical protein